VTVHKLSISLRPDLGAQVRSAASRAGQPVSSWVAEAVEARLRAQALDEFLEEWQAEHGRITDEELVRARHELGVPDGAAE
jgi:predicted transcriptional regulator